MPVLLVRHAHALARADWDGDDELRPLDGRGEWQAHELAVALLEVKPSRVVSSPAARCIATLAPLAAALGIGTEVSPTLAEGSYGPAIELVRSLSATDAALCTHGDVIPIVLEALGLDLGVDPRCEKASVWVLEAKKGRYYRRATYVKAPRQSG